MTDERAERAILSYAEAYRLVTECQDMRRLADDRAAQIVELRKRETNVADCHCKTSLNDVAHLGQKGLTLTGKTTGRGFVLGKFRDLYGQDCSIQESSSAEYHAIWLGVGDCRMHLTAEQARALAHIFLNFAADGDLTRSFEPSATAADA